jgi:hypothetical protein
MLKTKIKPIHASLVVKSLPASSSTGRKASGPPPAVEALLGPANRSVRASTKRSPAYATIEPVNAERPRKRTSTARFASKRSFEGAGLHSKSAPAPFYRCVDRRLISKCRITLHYGAQDYVDCTRRRSSSPKDDERDDNSSSRTRNTSATQSVVAKMKRMSLLTNDQATMRDDNGNIIARLFNNTKTNTVYLFRNKPSYHRQSPIAQANAKKMFGNSGTKYRLYKYAKVEIGRNNKAFYMVADGQTRRGDVIYKTIYVAHLRQQDKIIKIKSFNTSNVVATVRFDKYGAAYVFHIEEGADIAAIIAIEQTVYSTDEGFFYLEINEY